jgi:hypothetical protein
MQAPYQIRREVVQQKINFTKVQKRSIIEIPEILDLSEAIDNRLFILQVKH